MKEGSISPWEQFLGNVLDIQTKTDQDGKKDGVYVAKGLKKERMKNVVSAIIAHGLEESQKKRAAFHIRSNSAWSLLSHTTMFVKFRTEGFNGYSVQWSPFFENKLAVATASNFGLVGNGRLWLMAVGGPEGLMTERVYDTQDGLFDLAWSEVNENQLVTSSGDGSIKMWDITLSDFPIQNWQEHQREVFSVEWNLITKDVFASGSWDHTVKIWNPQAPRSIQTFTEHTHCVYSTAWSPYNPTMLLSGSGDQTVKIWDLKAPRSVQTLRAHQNEILCVDWNKYQDNLFATGSVDRTVKVWDMRRTDREVVCLAGHEYAVRRVRWSPHRPNILASAGYDMSVRFWDTAAPPGQNMIEVHDAHTEFVLGLDFNLYVEGQLASCAWDENVHVFMPPSLMHR